MSITKILTALAILATADLAAQAANAQNAGYEATSVKVAYGDLNLSSPAGAGAMASRVNQAVREACGDERGSADLPHIAAVRACSSKARDQALAKLDSPLVTAMIKGAPKGPSLAMASR